MSPAPLVSIVVPVHNDEGTIEAALASCLAQTLREIEVVCVDDASDDGTVAVIERMRRKDGRIRLIRHEENRSALQARRSGVFEARGDAVLFLDGDDEIDPRAAERSSTAMRSERADIVQFGVTVVDRHGNTGGSFEKRLRPLQNVLEGSDIIRGLFPPAVPARGQLWRYLFSADLLRRAYMHISDGLKLSRVNDLPLLLVVAALSERLVPINDKLYRYHLGRGGSGHEVDSIERARFYAGSIDSIDSIRDAINFISNGSTDPGAITSAYAAARLWIVGYVCQQLIERPRPDVADAAIDHLRGRVTDQELLEAAGEFSPGSLSRLAAHVSHVPISAREVRSILLATSTLRTGGVSAVLATQARLLTKAGYRVTVVARNGGSDTAMVPTGVEFIELPAGDLVARLTSWRELCHRYSVDVVVDHQMLYTRDWPEFAAMTRACGGATVGWLHNFVARPLLDGDGRLGAIEKKADVVAHIVALSPLDVAYLKLRGIAHASYLPNPPSAMLADASAPMTGRSIKSPDLKLIWWGRLEERTKRISELLEVAAHLKRRLPGFTLTIIGPDWGDLTAAKVNAAARRKGLADQVHAIGPRHGSALQSAIDEADAFISTSIIEGYQLTIAEAQSKGLPVFMYELPWLTLVQGNDGIVSAPQGDAPTLAESVHRVAKDAEGYAALSRASLKAAERARSIDFSDLYRKLVTGTPMPEFSPEPTIADAELLLGLLRFYAEASRAASARSGDAGALARRAETVWRIISPLGRRAIRLLPALRPLAHRLKVRAGIGR
ncbi:glycosyltransferase [Microbacterium sp. NPDC079995]|uniref:glycosyltransferase n=1 Tax=unclassified Microbacterium TaxID=2609290 RepID=UPI003450204A